MSGAIPIKYHDSKDNSDKPVAEGERTAAVPLSWREEDLRGWGLRDVARCRTLTPENTTEIADILESASRTGESVGVRGGGNSYGDAALNAGGFVLNLTHMNRIREWNPETGLITAEPGVTIADLWKHVISAGWWPSVVPGTSGVTLGGAASANVHGKNNWRIGCFGDYVRSFDLMLASGTTVTCSRDQHGDLFRAAIGGFGLLGVITSLTLQVRRIHSGRQAEIQRAYTSLDAMLAAVEEATFWATDIVGWVDTSATGRQLGRGLLKVGRDFLPGEDPGPESSLSAAAQSRPGLPALVPGGLIPRLATPLLTAPGVWATNRLQWLRGTRKIDAVTYATYASANFPLDAIPNWRDTYRPRGLIQHQSMVPNESASRALATMLARSHAAGIVPSFAVLKKHRSSDFLLTYLVDGYSLALDFPVRRGQESLLLQLMGELNEILLDYGGRCYLAKDSTLTADQARRMYPAGDLARLHALKQQYDPAGLFSTNLFRRVLA